jgi:hypothetical protein
MLCFGCFVSSVDELRIISKLSSFKTWVGSWVGSLAWLAKLGTCVWFQFSLFFGILCIRPLFGIGESLSLDLLSCFFVLNVE